MQSADHEIVVVLGISQWPDIDEIVGGLPSRAAILRAPDASAGLKALAPYAPCTITLLVPPDLRETLRFLDEIKSRFQTPACVIDPDDDERVERFCRLAGCAEYIAAGRLQSPNQPESPDTRPPGGGDPTRPLLHTAAGPWTGARGGSCPP